MKKRLVEVPKFMTFPNLLWTFKKWFFTVFLGDLEGAGWFSPPPRSQATSRSPALLGLTLIVREFELSWVWGWGHNCILYLWLNYIYPLGRDMSRLLLQHKWMWVLHLVWFHWSAQKLVCFIKQLRPDISRPVVLQQKLQWFFISDQRSIYIFLFPNFTYAMRNFFEWIQTLKCSMILSIQSNQLQI